MTAATSANPVTATGRSPARPISSGVIASASSSPIGAGANT